MIKLSLPVYYTKEYKTKEDKTFLVSLNWYRNAQYFEQNNVKQYYSDIITKLVTPFDSIDGSYQITYKYFYKNSTSDLPNVTPMTSKWVNDVLQSMKLVPNDNVKFLKREIHEVAGEDKQNPRVEVIIETLPVS